MSIPGLRLEPIVAGVLVLVVLALPFAPEVVAALIAAIDTLAGVADKSQEVDKLVVALISASVLAILVVIAMVVGSLADRFIDSALEALERHNRIRFALGHWKDWNETQWRTERWSDPYPEDTYRARLENAGEKANKSVEHKRAEIRFARTITFVLPGLVYAIAIAVVRWQYSRECVARNGVASPEWCTRAWDLGVLRIQMPEYESWPVMLPLAVACAVIWILSTILRRIDRIHKLDSLQGGAVAPPRLENTRTIMFAPPEPDTRFEWRRSYRWSPSKAARWQPRRTDHSAHMRIYAADRSLIPVHDANRCLVGDIALQPFTLVAAVLLLYTAAVASLSFDMVPALIYFGGGGALLTLMIGWVWWRRTNTYMTYLRDQGKELARLVEQHPAR